jgi:hypothetical protein
VAAVSGWKLESGALKAIDSIVSAYVADPAGPEFMAPPTRPVEEQRAQLLRTA